VYHSGYEESGQHVDPLGQPNNLRHFQEDVSVQEVVDHSIPFAVIDRPRTRVPPIRVELGR